MKQRVAKELKCLSIMYVVLIDVYHVESGGRVAVSDDGWSLSDTGNGSISIWN